MTIDLDASPEGRFGESLKMIVALHGWNHSFGPIFSFYETQLFQHVPADDLRILSVLVEKFWPIQASELKGLASSFAEIGHSEVDFEALCGWVYFHELMHSEFSDSVDPKSGCTALLTANSDGVVTHGRNMDNVPRELRNVTIHHKWKRNGTVLFESVSWYWITTGFMTGFSSRLTLEENWRFENRTFESMMNYFSAGTIPQVFWFRQMLETGMEFDAAQLFIQSTPLAAAMYVISTGPGYRQGTVYSRSQGKSNANPIYNLQNLTANFLVQTNYDRWEADPANDNRRTVAEEQMQAFNATDPLTMMATLSTYPVQNPETAYTCIMNANASTISAFLRQPITLQPSGSY